MFAALIALGPMALIGALFLIWIFTLRVVVPPNEVHIVQSSGATRSYGRSKLAAGTTDGITHTTLGNTYYRWPAWMPFIGVRVSKLSVSVFSLNLKDYAAYDKDRVPFVLDLTSFFRISDSNMAAERVSSMPELQNQLISILQGAARSILANNPIDEILGNRAIFGDQFTQAVEKQLVEWGVVPVKNIELMDIRDGETSKAITNIMAKKLSFIEAESRQARAENSRLAQIAEVEAAQAVGIRQQEAEETVGKRTADKTMNVGISNQKAAQAVAAEEAKTATANMVTNQVNQTRTAEIAKSVAITLAEQAREVARVNAEGTKLKAVTEAEGARDAALLNAEGIAAKGKADGEADTARLMAPVNAQVELAEKIGENKDYQDYMVRIKQVDANKDVGIAQAAALQKADIKIVTTATDAASGLDLVSLGTKVGAVVTAVKTALTEAK